MKSIQKTKDWLEMALDDMDDAVSDLGEGRYPSSVFHAQQCTEKILKSVLYFFGVVQGKTHFPSDILGYTCGRCPKQPRDLA
jgi:HEPN domain-containing protein